MSIQWPSCFFNLCSSCSSRSNKRRRDCLLPPPRGRLCYHAGLTASPPHHTPIAGLAIPLLNHTCCYSPATADEPVNPHTVVLPSTWKTTAESSLPPCCSLPRPRPVHRPSALGAAWSMWSTTFHRKSTVRGEPDSWVHGHIPVFL